MQKMQGKLRQQMKPQMRGTLVDQAPPDLREWVDQSKSTCRHHLLEHLGFMGTWYGSPLHSVTLSPPKWAQQAGKRTRTQESSSSLPTSFGGPHPPPLSTTMAPGMASVCFTKAKIKMPTHNVNSSKWTSDNTKNKIYFFSSPASVPDLKKETNKDLRGAHPSFSFSFYVRAPTLPFFLLVDHPCFLWALTLSWVQLFY